MIKTKSVYPENVLKVTEVVEPPLIIFVAIGVYVEPAAIRHLSF
jgi:hypothetical protein